MAGITVQAAPPEASEINAVVGVGRERKKRGPAPRSLADRLWEKVDKNGPTQPHMDTPCWVFTGHRSGGYGRISTGGHCGKMIPATHAAWIVTNGPLPDGVELAHRCDYPPCCRPDHVFPASHSENMKDCAAKGRLSPRRLESKNKGEANGRARLGANQVAAIRSMPGNAKTAADLFGVSKATVYAIRQRRIWRDAA